MSVTRKSSLALDRYLAGLTDEIVAAMKPALTKSADEVAADAATLARSSRRTGALIDSIAATGPGETTPAYASDGGKRTASETEAFITAGSDDARHAHLVEFGTAERTHKDGTSTGKMPSDPFLLLSWRLNKRRVENRILRAIRKAVRDAG